MLKEIFLHHGRII